MSTVEAWEGIAAMNPVNTLADVCWAERELEVRDDSVRQRSEIIATEFFWQPSSADTELEITWDKIRLDASDENDRRLAEGRHIEPIALARSVAQGHGIDWDTVGFYRDVDGCGYGPGMIINFVTDDLQRHLTRQGEA